MQVMVHLSSVSISTHINEHHIIFITIDHMDIPPLQAELLMHSLQVQALYPGQNIVQLFEMILSHGRPVPVQVPQRQLKFVISNVRIVVTRTIFWAM